MSADEYRKSQNNNENLIGEDMRYQNKTIFKTPGASTWYTRYRDAAGQHYISGKTQLEVYNKLKLALKNKITEKKQIELVITLKTWINKWYKLYKSELRERSLNDLIKITDKIPKQFLNKNLKQFTPFELNDYIYSIGSARTRAKTYVVLNDIFDKAYKNDLIEKNPFLKLKKPKYEPKERETLSTEEQNQLLSKITNAEYYVYAIALLQGLRPGELMALEYRDVDFKKMTITINKAIDDESDDTEVKNEYSNRTIPLFKQTFEIIKDINTNSNERFAKHTAKVTNEKLKELLNNITDKNISLYNLRHTFITKLQNANIPEHIIQTWVGHAKGSKVTKQVYTHVTDEAEFKYINILNAD